MQFLQKCGGSKIREVKFRKSAKNVFILYSDTEKVQIPKVYSHYGFKYYLDAPTSSSVRREDDKVL